MIVGVGDDGQVVLGSPLVDELPTRRPAHGEIRPIAELRTWGLLWLLNRVVCNPRGYAVAFAVDDGGEVIGWTLLGDGSSPIHLTLPDETRLLERVHEILVQP